MRNLDLTALRSFVTVAEAGGVTRAAGLLNLTQSAVSMQLKRLEESLDLTLLDRSARRIGLTAAGEQLLSYARRMLSLNDEAVLRLTDSTFEGEVTLGVPHDIIHRAIPQVLQSFSTTFPRIKLRLLSSYTAVLKKQFARGEVDVILTTEREADPGGEVLVTRPMVWVGAPGGQAWRQRPLRLAFEPNCIFRARTQAGLDAAGIPWEMAVEADSSRAIEATIGADLGVCTMLEGTEPAHLEQIVHGGALPDVGETNIILYSVQPAGGSPVADLTALLRNGLKAF